MSTNHTYDAIIVGGGHNGLAAAAYLSRAGRKVLLLEKLGHSGGAAVSAQAFDGVGARLSRYSYLVSLLPQQIIDDLGLRITLARRRYSSYTPDPADPGRALLVDNEDAAATAASFAAVGASEDEFRAFNDFYAGCGKLTQALWPTMTSPLPTRSAARQLALAAGAAEAWEAMIEQPIGHAITRALRHDLVRGVVLTDALIGTFARADDADLQQNICFLYHLIGGGTGDWDVPVGGMGAVSGSWNGPPAKPGRPSWCPPRSLGAAGRRRGLPARRRRPHRYRPVGSVQRGTGGAGPVAQRRDRRVGGGRFGCGRVGCGRVGCGFRAGTRRDPARHTEPEPPPRGRPGQSEPAAQTAAPVAGRVREPGSCLRRHLPHQ